MDEYEYTPEEIERFEEAKAELDRAITKCLKILNNDDQPNMYIDGWVLISHKRTPELEQQNTSAVGYLHPTGQAWPTTVGMLKLGLNQVERP